MSGAGQKYIYINKSYGYKFIADCCKNDTNDIWCQANRYSCESHIRKMPSFIGLTAWMMKCWKLLRLDCDDASHQTKVDPASCSIEGNSFDWAGDVRCFAMTFARMQQGPLNRDWWCERRDSNSHASRRWNLNPVRLPIPPLSLFTVSYCSMPF